MTARRKSGGFRKSSVDRSDVLQLIFYIVVIAAVGWFIYSSYSERRPVSKTHKSGIVQAGRQKTADVRPRAAVVSPSPVRDIAPRQFDDFESDEVLRRIEKAEAAASSLKEDRSSRSPAAEIYPEIAMASKPRKVKKTRKPKIVFVIDDIGHTDEYQSLVFALGDKITYAILPDLEHSRHFNAVSRQTGADVILHLPLEAQSGTYPGPGLITSKMSDKEVLQMLEHNFQSAPRSIGVNNHMGSLGSTDRRLIKVILGELKRRRKFFLDSYTTKDSVIQDVGREMGMKIHRRDVFLDNTDEQSYVRKQIKQLADAAYENGFAIGIGHYRYNTLKVINEEIPRLEDSGYEIIRLSDLY